MSDSRKVIEYTIKPGNGFDLGIFREIWEYRELFWALAWRSTVVRYKQTVVGVMWTLVRPLITMVVFTVLFGRLAKLPSEGVPYPLLTFAGILPWQLFAQGLGSVSNSLVSEGALIGKVYFPRLIIPASACLTAVIDFVVSGAILMVMMVAYGVLPTWRIAALPGFILLAMVATLGPGLWLGALQAKYRDVGNIVPFLIQIGVYVSPVGFSSAIVPDRWRLLYSLNPMVTVIDGFRWSVLGVGSVQPAEAAISVAASVAVLVGGVLFFRSRERTFADVI